MKEKIIGFLKEIATHKLALALIYVLAALVICKLIKVIFDAVSRKKEGSIKATFMKGVLEAVVVIYTFLRLAQLSDIMSRFASAILMSSSLLVVVFGFIFQEGLSNIIHGFILTVFKPFDVGDRVEVNTGQDKISGYIKSMTLRHTVIVSIADNAESIIPNSILDQATIRNLTTQNMSNRYPLIVGITYEDAQNPRKMKQAKQIISDTILSNHLTVDPRQDKEQPLFVKVDLEDSAVTLTCFIDTKTAEDNYTACSEIREQLLFEFEKADIHFAYPHLEITGSVPGQQSGKEN